MMLNSKNIIKKITEGEKIKMSNLYWFPKPKDKEQLPNLLKIILMNRYSTPLDTLLNHEDINYLQGLRDAGVQSAQVLLDAIDRYGDIHIKADD